jgi:hypothetical protein
MYRVWIASQGRWIENVPASEARVYLEEGYTCLRMDLPYRDPA